MRPLVLLHGFTGAPSSWHDVVAHLAPGRLVVPLALVGHRGGPVADETTSWGGEVTRLARVLDGLGDRSGDRVVLAGYSLGARLALAVALARPRRVAGLVLVSVSGGLADEEARRVRAEADDTLARSIEDEGIAAFVGRWEALPLFASQAALPVAAREAHRARRLENEAGPLAASLRALSKGRMPYLVPSAGSLAIPTTMLAGELDPGALRSAEALAAVMPSARVERVPGVGHDLLLERPAAVARAIDEIGRARPARLETAP